MISPCYNSRYCVVHLKNAWRQLFFCNRKRVIHQTAGCNCSCKLTQYLSNTCQINCIYAIPACMCCFKNPIHSGMDCRSYFCEIKKHCTLKRYICLDINTSIHFSKFPNELKQRDIVDIA